MASSHVQVPFSARAAGKPHGNAAQRRAAIPVPGRLWRQQQKNTRPRGQATGPSLLPDGNAPSDGCGIGRGKELG